MQDNEAPGPVQAAQPPGRRPGAVNQMAAPNAKAASGTAHASLLKFVTSHRDVFQGLYGPGWNAHPGAGSLDTMTSTLARILSASALGVLVTGQCHRAGRPVLRAPRATRCTNSRGTSTTPRHRCTRPRLVYRAPGVIYSVSPPPPVYYGGRDRHDDRWDKGRDRNDWRERERDRDRAERDRAARERDQREQQAREADRRARERDQARREQAERDRRAADDRRTANPGQLAPGSYTPHPQDWRSRQFSNSRKNSPELRRRA